LMQRPCAEMAVAGAPGLAGRAALAAAPARARACHEQPERVHAAKLLSCRL
jgi:hypothetical protein